MACNERCPFCNVPAEDYRVLTPPDQVILDELEGFLEAGAKTLTISGGEPTLLRKRLIELVRRARRGGVQFVELQTNAVLITTGYAAALVEAGVTSAFVSFLSHRPELHDELTGLEGSWAKCLAGIDALLDAGARVTLNPVMARTTQHLVPEYMDFVAQRLPRVRFVSMSAVQPHGRGKRHLDLMPDYAVLRTAVPAARARALVHGIGVVNPYCGLPLCVGWNDDPAHSVEAWEGRRGGWRQTQGLENRGDKSHGACCAGCALRTRCGGAWHAYWTVRGGSGISPPVGVVEPWSGLGDPLFQGVVEAPHGPDELTYRRLNLSDQPTVWLFTARLSRADESAILGSQCTDLAVMARPEPLLRSRSTLRALGRLVRAGRTLQPQARVRVTVGLELEGVSDAASVTTAVDVLAELGVDAIRLLSDDARWSRYGALLRQRGLDIGHVRPKRKWDA